MAFLNPQPSSVKGELVTYAAATATTGDTFSPDDRSVLRVRNNSAVSVNVTLVTPGADRYGAQRPDIVTAIAAGLERQFGGFDADLADPMTGFVTAICSPAASVVVAYSRTA